MAMMNYVRMVHTETQMGLSVQELRISNDNVQA